MKRIIMLFNIFFVTIAVQSQNIKEDTTRILQLIKTHNVSPYDQPDSALVIADSIISLSNKVNYEFGMAQGHYLKAECYWVKGDYARSMYHVLQQQELYRKLKYDTNLALSYSNLAQIYYEMGDYSQALQYNFETRRFFLNASDTIKTSSFQLPKERVLMMNNLDLAKSYLLGNILDSALFYGETALSFFRNSGQLWTYPVMVVGEIFEKMNRDSTALSIYNLETARDGHNDWAEINIGKAMVFKKMHLIDSSRYYAKKALEIAQSNHYLKSIMRASDLLSSTYEQSNTTEFIKYLKIADAARDSLYSKEKINQLNGFLLNNELRQRDREAGEIKYKNQRRTFLLLMTSVIFLVAGISLWRNNQLRKKSNILLKNEKEKVEETLRELKSTQAQLIQSGKMASLGELTAGIAHEIQNPLNFVNNFSEVSAELLKDMKSELIKGNSKEAIGLADNVVQNLEKINHHGRRADIIVKGMLQHSRSTSDKKELTDINALCGDYIRLAFHGLKAKDAGFQAKYETHFDPDLPRIHVIPQDLGRALLNIINNAFQACAERSLGAPDKRTRQGESSNPSPVFEDYQPTVILTTLKEKNKVIIKIADNGPGIPDSIKDKIFQPFFTTKPTGQGTGLGLSLAYDIIKANGGTIDVKSPIGEEGTEFSITLPIQ